MRAHASGKEPVDSPAPGRARPAAPARLPGGVGAPASPPLLALQPTLGNAAVNRLREREEESARSGAGEAATDVQRSTVHNVLRSPGRPMDGALKDDMESRFNADFSDVRLHTGTAARESAAGIGARAYTSGNHVVVGDGGADKHTLAHELTHVIQQREGPVTGTDNGSGLKVSDPSDAFERAAEANATAVMRAPSVQRSRTADAERATEATARTGSFVQRAGGEENAEPYFDADGDVYTNSDSATAVRTADGCDLMVSGSSLEYIDANGSISELWHKGNVLTTADVLCTPAGVLVHKATGQEIYKTTSADYEKQVEISAELLERIGTPQTVSVAGVHYKSVLRSRREGWGDGAAQDFSIGDARAEDGWRGMYLATSREHARGYLNPGGVLLEIATPNMRAYDLTSLDYEALGFASPLASARLVKALLGFDQDQDLMTSLAERNMVLQSGEPGGAVEVIVPYGLANARCSVTGELEQRDQ